MGSRTNIALPLHIEQGLKSVRPLPFVVHKILELAKEDPVDFQAMSRTVASDQTLSALIISVANSAGLSNRYKQITSLKQAMVMLGRQHVVQIVIAYTFQTMQTIGATKWPLGGERFWKHCLAVGTMASQLAVKIGLPYPEEAFIAGLLHDIGKIIMLNEYKNPYAQLLQSTRNNLTPLFLNEKKIFNCHHAEVGAALCIRWKIPTPLTSAVEEHHANPTSVFAAIVNLVGASNRIVKLLGFGDGSNAFVSTHPHACLALTRLTMADKLDLYTNLGSTIAKLGNMTMEHEEEDASAPDTRFDKRAIYFDITNATEQEILIAAAVRIGYRDVHMIQSADDAREVRGDLDNTLVTDKPEKWSARGGSWARIAVFNEWREKQPNVAGSRISFVRLTQWLEQAVLGGAAPPPEPEIPEAEVDAPAEDTTEGAATA